ncbi:MAG: pyrroline-5-carboxylate reductase [Chlorobiaceae bacterium]|nr:pyrroline-5-carboxylate reductase [Chlorobiaceae bacterium]NTV61190.1 pyrroline-5-carboxylate reductase [Chlorobiaceae bacterium]
MNHVNIGFAGTGRIARALVSGLCRKEQITLWGYDREPAALKAVTEEFPVSPCPSLEEIARACEVIILAVKPYQIEEVLEVLKPYLSDKHLLISVAAGISTDFIQKCTGESIKVIRAMPNTPAFVGEGMTAICRGTGATAENLALAGELFSSIGRVAVLEEFQMDAATALSGSGPAYMFHIIDSLSGAGITCGLSSREAILLSAQTMLGAAKMVLTSEKSPEELKHEVTTPGGTTEAGLKILNEKNIRQILAETVAAAAARSRELMK